MYFITSGAFICTLGAVEPRFSPFEVLTRRSGIYAGINLRGDVSCHDVRG